MAEDRAGQAYRGDKRHAVTACAEMRPALRAVIGDDRIYGAMEDLLGTDLIWLGSDGNYYTGDTAWHSDGTVMDMGRIKVRCTWTRSPVTPVACASYRARTRCPCTRSCRP